MKRRRYGKLLRCLSLAWFAAVNAIWVCEPVWGQTINDDPDAVAAPKARPYAPKMEPEGTPEDPANLAQYGYTSKEIRGLYAMRKDDARREEAEALTEGKQWNQAIAIYRELINLDPRRNDYPCWRGAGEAYRGKGDLARAIDCYRHAVYQENDPAQGKAFESDGGILARFALLLRQARLYDE